ncbi:hypothetical protein BGZ51_002087 [Haplosporangium sp. Z 767]|nr:hypothetical protein BGZ51_002087 [Haplosporangium sp. Z 767]KAF9195342.1 hypothetical protein BGZ50_004718 [Haplosporangium sp. Z 11]
MLELRRRYPSVEPPKPRDDNAMDVDQQEQSVPTPVDPELKKQLHMGLQKGNMLLSVLKNINRQVCQQERNLRNDLTEQKLNVSKVDLGYQNIKYQRKYLLNEIARCHDMETIYQEVPLVSLEQFRETAPENLVSSSTDDHRLMLNRLQFELEERKRFDAEKRRLLAVKLQLVKANKARKAQLTKCEKQLEAYVQSSQSIQDLLQEPVEPIQTHQELLPKETPAQLTASATSATPAVATGAPEPMDISFQEVQAQPEAEEGIVAPIRIGTTDVLKRNDVAQYLPPPLYILFRHACAFSATFGDEVRAEIQGDVQAAQVEVKVLNLVQQTAASKAALNTTSRARAIATSINMDAPSAPKDMQADEDENVGMGHRGSESKADDQYERFPLDVVIKIKKDALVNSHTIVHMRFGYLTRLGIVVVAVEAAPGILKLDQTLILQELFPKDNGEICPNSEAAFLDMSSYDTLVSSDGGVGEQGSDLVLDVTKSGGYAFRWAQEICGLEFLGPLSQGWGPYSGTDLENAAAGETESSTATALSGTGNRRAFLSQVIRMIRNRRRAWKALERQLEDLDRNIIPTLKNKTSGVDMNITNQLNNARTKVSITGWHALESSSKYTLVYSVQFVMPDPLLSSRAISAKIVVAEATVEIGLAYVDRLPRWELKPGPGFPSSLKVTNSNGTQSEETNSLSADEPMDTASQASKAASDEDSKEKSPFLDALMNTVNIELPASLYGAEPGERNMLLTLQLTRIVVDLSAILDSVSG